MDDLPNIDNHYFEQMGSQVYLTELQLKANSLDNEATSSYIFLAWTCP